MPSYPYTCADHIWATGEIGTADLLNRLPHGELAGDRLSSDRAITTEAATVKCGGGSGPNIVFQDSRIIKVSAYGNINTGTGNTVVARLYWGGSVIQTWTYNADLNILTNTDLSVSLWARVYPCAAGTTDAWCSFERIGANPLTVKTGLQLSIEDIGSTTHLAN